MDDEPSQEEVDAFARELAEAISPCSVCGNKIEPNELVTGHGDWYRHVTCIPDSNS